MKDMLGNEIKVGKMVAYPVRHSSSMWMSYGRVVKVVEGELNTVPRSHHQYYYNKWSVEPHLKIRIRGDRYNRDIASRPARTVQVVVLDRIIVVPHVQFNEEDREFFELDCSHPISHPIILNYPLGG